jgi:hypothetical protein
MSESENLNFDSPSSEHPDDGLQILSDLQPQPLEVNRDELLFQAGFAAGKNHRGTRYFWPSAVAALLLVCVGLGARVISDVISMNRMHQEIAASKNAPTQTIAQSEPEAGQQTDETRTYHDRFFTDRQQRAWLRLASAAPLPPGRLTAAGWEDMPQSAISGQSKDNLPDKPDAPPHRPATYLELMRTQGEG